MNIMPTEAEDHGLNLPSYAVKVGPDMVGGDAVDLTGNADQPTADRWPEVQVEGGHGGLGSGAQHAIVWTIVPEHVFLRSGPSWEAAALSLTAERVNRKPITGKVIRQRIFRK